MPILGVLRRTLFSTTLLFVTAVAVLAAWAARLLAQDVLGAQDGFLEEMARSSRFFAAALALSLAEPLEVQREAARGVVLLRVARGGSTGLLGRWIGLILALVPIVLLTSLAAGVGLVRVDVILLELAAVVATGLLCGAWLDRPLLVPAFWGLVIAAHLRPWIGEPIAWLLPALGRIDGPVGALHALMWSAGALLIADLRLTRVARQPG